MRALVQLQLSNYDTYGNFILEADSGFQMVLGRTREFLKLDPELHIDIVGPERFQLITQPEDINPDVFASGRVKYIETYIIPNAPLTRYDFNAEHVALRLNLKAHRTDESLRYDFVYVNDPMLLRHYRAVFYLYAGYLPKFVVHSHFVDCPGNPKFPTEVSLWHGQCEAALKADFNFWQCQSALDEFLSEMKKWYKAEHVNVVKKKSQPWDDGFSMTEMDSPIKYDNIRFDCSSIRRLANEKTIIFVPNRIGGLGRSSDYTQAGRFMFDVLPKLWEKCPGDFAVIAGNPSQKISNEELIEKCGQFGYVNLVEGTFNRDEYRWLADTLGAGSHLALGWYTQDTFGGTASRELVHKGMFPVWVNNFEYADLAKEVSLEYPTAVGDLCKPDFSNAIPILWSLVHRREEKRAELVNVYQKIIRRKCSFEQSTPIAYDFIKNVIECT